MRKEAVLLVGNGINRLSQDYSWENLLEDLIAYIGKKHTIQFKKEKPFTLLYEEIYLRARKYRGKNEIKLKEKITELMGNLKVNEFHTKFLNLGVKHILTTNYDYNLERSYMNHIGESDNLSSETKYNLFRRRKVDDTYIWHIHGEAEVAKSITLGHGHYVGYLQKMRNHLTGKKRNILDFEKTKDIYSWVDLFIKDNVYIVGSSLDYTEIDLWWLLIYKERSRYEKNIGHIGKTIYYYFYDNNLKPKKEAKLSLLESYGVEVKRQDVQGNYKKAYERFIEEFKTSANSGLA